MKRISIDLTEPLERVLALALTLPAGPGDGGIGEARIKEAVRRLYDAANGRTVDTPLGRIPIAPAIAPWLKAAPLAVRTRHELLELAGLSTGFNSSASGKAETGESR